MNMVDLSYCSSSLKACRNNDVAVKKTEGNKIVFIFMIRLHFGKNIKTYRKIVRLKSILF